MRLVCENHPTKAWPDECDCGPGMADPVMIVGRDWPWRQFEIIDGRLVERPTQTEPPRPS